MNKMIYNKFLLIIMILSDLLSGLIAYNLSFGYSVLNNFPIIFSKTIAVILFIQFCWSSIFFFANLYNTRATLSRFDEIIRFFKGCSSSII